VSVATHCNTLPHVHSHFYIDPRAKQWTHVYRHVYMSRTRLDIFPHMRMTRLDMFPHMSRTRLDIFPHMRMTRLQTSPVGVATYCNILQHTATYCNTLQHTATHFQRCTFTCISTLTHANWHAMCASSYSHDTSV